MHWFDWVEPVGAIAGIAGSVLMATRRTKTAFAIWLVSNLALGAFAFAKDAHWLSVMYVAYFATSALGIYNHRKLDAAQSETGRAAAIRLLSAKRNLNPRSG